MGALDTGNLPDMVHNIGYEAVNLYCFYPTAFQSCAGIVFTHGVWMGVRVGGAVNQAVGLREKACPGCISETLRCKILILKRGIGFGGVGVQHQGLIFQKS